jgi:hypothetical protein
MLSTDVVDQDADKPGTSLQPNWLAKHFNLLFLTHRVIASFDDLQRDISDFADHMHFIRLS